MGAYKTLKRILLDKDTTITTLADIMGKPRNTVTNTLYKDNLRAKNLSEYGKALGCTLCLIDDETGEIYKIEY